jgi:hypothetical protein
VLANIVFPFSLFNEIITTPKMFKVSVISLDVFHVLCYVQYYKNSLKNMIIFVPNSRGYIEPTRNKINFGQKFYRTS